MSAASNAPKFDAVDYDPFAQASLARVVPVTEPQREVWLADKLGSEGSLAYNESVSLRLRGVLDEQALCAAVRELGTRHESLRATISPNGDDMCIAEDFVLETERHDLSALEAGARDVAVRERLRAVTETPFDLERGPLVRAELLVLAVDEHLLVLTAHHIVCDGWSFGVLVRDLAAAYARNVGQPGAHERPAQSFAEYALSQGSLAGSEQAMEDERYWLSRFTGSIPTLDLPNDRPRPRQRTFAAGREDAMLDAELVAALRKLGASKGASLFATLFTGFSTLMRRLSGQSDVVVGFAAAGQAAGGHDALVGHCVNILPVRSDMATGTGFAATLATTGELLLDAFEHQQYTFGTLLQKLAIPRDPSRLPLVSVLFNLDQPLDDGTVRFPGLEFEFSANARSHENFELFVNAVPVNGGLRLECQYNRDLYDAASIKRWMDALETLLRSAIAQPDCAWDQLEWVSAREMQALRALQPPRTQYDADLLVHQRFAEHAANAPDRIAIAFSAQELSYADLDRRSNAIGHALRARNVARGALVGVCLEREPDLYATVLGVLKAGAAFVPLDPTYPKDRLNYMVEDAGLRVVVSKTALLDTIDYARERVLALDADLDDRDWNRVEPLVPDEHSATPDTAAYVIYTSGSTGKPKGVVVPRRALVNLLCSMQRSPGFSADDSLVAVTTMSFDMSIPELFLPLTAGGRVVVASRDDARDGHELRRLLEASGATAMQATPSGWRLLVEAGWSGGAGFKALAGGEGLPQDLAVTLRDRCGELWNMYGPTETTVWSTCAHLRAPEQGISIGKPIANTSVWILDERQQPCPVGVPGEIWIGGDGVTLGYLNRPELTAERFVADPWSDQPDARMYRTGDRGRWRNDGSLEHLGRLDFQVKVRGYRIELGEIEANLASHPGIERCVVTVREDRPGDVRLVAYVVAAAGAEPSADEMRQHLQAALPAYMVPQHFVQLDTIPLSPNGKIDRKALPAPDFTAQGGVARIAPRTDLERRIAAIMEDVLALPGIGVDDDFFALGGHSLLAAQLTSRLNRELDVSLSLRTLFDAPTVARLAEAVTGASSADGGPVPVPIVRRTDRRRAPLSLMQERLRMIEAFNPGTLSYNTPSGHRLTGPLDVATLDEAFHRLAQRQTVLRTSIAIEDGEPVQLIHDDIDTGLAEVIDLSHLPHEQREAELARRLRGLVEMPFADLSQAPLFCARLYRLADDEHALFFMPHHIIWDGWSFDLMYADLAEIYAALVEGREPNLPELPVSYGDYAAWHREWVQGPQYAKQVAFWRERLGGPNSEGGRPQALPTDLPRKRGMSGTSRSCSVAVPGDLTEALYATSRQLDVTLFVTLLSAYYVLLGQTAGQRDMVIGTPVRGRNMAEVEGLMGYFTNLLPLRVELDPSQPFAELVRAVRGVVLDSFASPDIRLEDLTRELSLKSEGGGTMLYQALFSFQDIRHRAAHWGNLDHSRIEVFQPGATEDLGLWFVQDDKGMTGGLIYNADILHGSSIQRMRGRYLYILQAAARDPRQSIAELVANWDLTEAGQDAGQEQQIDKEIPMHTSATAIEHPVAEPREAYLIRTWTELLGFEVKPSDNFFDVGGNSMLAVQMAERVARETGYRIKLMQLAAQSVAQIAADLPASATSHAQTGKGLKLIRSMKRLFGGHVAAE